MEISKMLKYDPFNLKFEVLITLVILIGYISINRIRSDGQRMDYITMIMMVNLHP